MAKIVIVRYTTRDDAADENQKLVQDVFAELAANEPDGLRYATFRLDDGVTFMHIAVTDGEYNPLLETAAFRAFTREIGDRCVDGPTPSVATLVGSYRLVAD
jgi:hypothetical protein